MEGRMRSSANQDDKSDDPPIWPPSKRRSASCDVIINDVDRRTSWRRASFNLQLPFVTPPLIQAPSTALETYVVQYPKDQIYRVPPPENATYIEQHGQPAKKEISPIWNQILWTIVLLVVLGILTGVAIGIFHLVYSPKPPTFSIAKINVEVSKTNAHSQHKSNTSDPLAFFISLQVKNHNARMGIDYTNGNEDPILIHKDKIFARGKFPEMSQAASESSTIDLSMKVGSSSKKNMPVASQKNDVPLVLKFDVNSKYRVRSLNLWKKRVVVTCKLKVKSLETKPNVLTQYCTSDFKS